MRIEKKRDSALRFNKTIAVCPLYLSLSLSLNVPFAWIRINKISGLEFFTGQPNFTREKGINLVDLHIAFKFTIEEFILDS